MALLSKNKGNQFFYSLSEDTDLIVIMAQTEIFDSALTTLPPPFFLFRAQIFKRLWSPGIDSKEPIPPACEARRAGT